MVQQIKPRKTGWKPKQSEERKAQVYAHVKRKHFNEFKALITELAKPFR